MKIALGQLNPIVGDLVGNAQQISEAIRVAHRQDADLLVTSELVLIGYPPRDLLLRSGVVDQCQWMLETLAQEAGGMPVLVGHPAAAISGMRPLVNEFRCFMKGV